MNQKVQLYGLVGVLVVGVIVLGLLAKQGAIKFPTRGKVDQGASDRVLALTKLPLAAGHPNVVNVTSFYTLVGEVGKISNELISLRTSDPPLPDFPISKDTRYFIVTKPNSAVPASFSDITVGASAILTLSFDQEKNSWKTLRVTLSNIIKPNSATPSAVKK